MKPTLSFQVRKPIVGTFTLTPNDAPVTVYSVAIDPTAIPAGSIVYLQQEPNGTWKVVAK